MKKIISSIGKHKYLAPDSKVITMESEGFIATSGDVPDYGDGGELTQMYNPKPDKNKLIG
ncbi:MAG: hypothetical protein LKM37_04075 [Bacteroidales bacterium]|jgi:hypothetical protein|nr:hypothetical protein [Bacteroidales bacterium]